MSAPIATGGDESNMAGPAAVAATSEPIRLALIAALTRSNGLGAKGTLPWHLPKEMAHFRKATTTMSAEDKEQGKRNAVIMGRKTWESIPQKFRPLKGRINVIVSRQSSKEASQRLGIDEAPDSHLVDSLDAAVALLSSIPIRSQLARSYLIGGAQLYDQALRTAPEGSILDRLLTTRIYSPAYDECDVFLPEFRSSSQIVDEAKAVPGGEDDVPPQPLINDDATSPWTKASQEDFNEYMGGAVVEGVVEEKDNKYELQMWTRRQA